MYTDMFLLNQECPCYIRALIISIQVNKLAVVTQGWFSNEGNCLLIRLERINGHDTGIYSPGLLDFSSDRRNNFLAQEHQQTRHRFVLREYIKVTKSCKPRKHC